MKKREIKEENQNQDKINNIRKKLGIVYYLLAILAGPIEILVVYLLYGKRDDVNVLAFIGFLFFSTVIYRIILFVLKTVIYKITKYEYDTPILILFISYIVSYFVSIIIAGESVGTSLILCIFIVGIKGLPIILGSDSGTVSKNVTTAPPQKNKKVTATTINYGSHLSTTEYEDEDGNRTTVEHWKF